MAWLGTAQVLAAYSAARVRSPDLLEAAHTWLLRNQHRVRRHAHAALITSCFQSLAYQPTGLDVSHLLPGAQGMGAAQEGGAPPAQPCAAALCCIWTWRSWGTASDTGRARPWRRAIAPGGARRTLRRADGGAPDDRAHVKCHGRAEGASTRGVQTAAH